MSFIKDLGKIIEKRDATIDKLKSEEHVLTEVFAEADADNILCHGDNLTVMKALLEKKNMNGKVKLIYIDPPFFSKANYDATVNVSGSNIKLRAYEDKWNKGLMDYLSMLDIRLALMKDLLSDDGLIWLHLDWHVVHYAKLLMDDVFGAENFVNEIIWTYKSGGSTKRHFSRKHDTILVYSKTANYNFYPLKEKSYNRGFKPYRFKDVEEFQDEKGWYTMVNMKDVWNIDMVGRTSSERTGYATQKPEQLIERIISSCTREGDLCADFFCGSGTFPVVCGKMNRQFIACDEGNLAIKSTENRLVLEKIPFRLYEHYKKKQEGLKVEIEYNLIDENTVKIQIKSLQESEFHAVADKKSLETVNDISIDKSLLLIESWSIDANFDGQVHRPTKVFIKNKGKIETNTTLKIDKDNIISLKVLDVFGNVYLERINYERDTKGKNH